MRFVYFLLLLAFIAAVGVFAWQNHEEVTLHYLDRTLAAPLSLLIGAVYLLGMLSGWTVVGMLKRSVQRVTERRTD
jgi:lipopolysaccharide assembly protein A